MGQKRRLIIPCIVFTIFYLWALSYLERNLIVGWVLIILSYTLALFTYFILHKWDLPKMGQTRKVILAIIPFGIVYFWGVSYLYQDITVGLILILLSVVLLISTYNLLVKEAA